MLREKLSHKAEDNIGLSQTTQSIVIIISHGVIIIRNNYFTYFGQKFADRFLAYTHRGKYIHTVVLSL